MYVLNMEMMELFYNWGLLVVDAKRGLESYGGSDKTLSSVLDLNEYI